MEDLAQFVFVEFDLRWLGLHTLWLQANTPDKMQKTMKIWRTWKNARIGGRHEPCTLQSIGHFNSAPHETDRSFSTEVIICSLYYLDGSKIFNDILVRPVSTWSIQSEFIKLVWCLGLSPTLSKTGQQVAEIFGWLKKLDAVIHDTLACNSRSEVITVVQFNRALVESKKTKLCWYYTAWLEKMEYRKMYLNSVWSLSIPW